MPHICQEFHFCGRVFFPNVGSKSQTPEIEYPWPSFHSCDEWFGCPTNSLELKPVTLNVMRQPDCNLGDWEVKDVNLLSKTD